MPTKSKVKYISYNSQRIALDAICGFVPIITTPSRTNSADLFGVRFHLRNGEIIEQSGTDNVSRDILLKFLDKHFNPTAFIAHKCQACVYKKDTRTNCSKNRDCREYTYYKGFKREE